MSRRLLMLALKTIIDDNLPEIQQRKLIDSLRIFANKQELTELEINHLVSWVLRFTRFHSLQHPSNLTKSDVEAFISQLSTEHNYSQAIQLQAIKAITFLYNKFLKINLGDLDYIKLSNRIGFFQRYEREACVAVIDNMQGCSLLMSKLALFGNLKLREVANLKISDINIKENTIKIRNNNGAVKFTINIPFQIILDLRIQLMRSRQLNQVSKNEQSSVSQLHLIDSLIDKEGGSKNDFLFSIASLANPIASNSEQILAILKNDIRIAIKQYSQLSYKQKTIKLRSMSNSNSASSQARDITSDCKLQSSFNFKATSSNLPRFALGAA